MSLAPATCQSGWLRKACSKHAAHVGRASRDIVLEDAPVIAIVWRIWVQLLAAVRAGGKVSATTRAITLLRQGALEVHGDVLDELPADVSRPRHSLFRPVIVVALQSSSNAARSMEQTPVGSRRSLSNVPGPQTSATIQPQEGSASSAPRADRAAGARPQRESSRGSRRRAHAVPVPTRIQGGCFHSPRSRSTEAQEAMRVDRWFVLEYHERSRTGSSGFPGRCGRRECSRGCGTGHVLRLERCSKRSMPSITATHVSCTTSSATTQLAGRSSPPVEGTGPPKVITVEQVHEHVRHVPPQSAFTKTVSSEKSRAVTARIVSARLHPTCRAQAVSLQVRREPLQRVVTDCGLDALNGDDAVGGGVHDDLGTC